MGAFLSALSVLSKSSPQAVEIEHSQRNVNKFKDYLYIPTDLEKDFEKIITDSPDGKIIFVCGSSGDGKSAILTKYSQKEKFKNIKFHLDATHALTPQYDAIATLDNLFQNYSSHYIALVIGINIGMIANYIEKGKDDKIKKELTKFIQGEEYDEGFYFLSFEDKKYSKFNFDNNKATSGFTKSLLSLLTAEHNNPFRDAMTEAELNGDDKIEIINYKFLCIHQVQEVIIDLLVRIRLAKDQFLTTRSLLDFIFNLLVGPKYIFDNLFTSENSELINQLKIFDPSLVRAKCTDGFLLEQKLCLENQAFIEFKETLIKNYDLVCDFSGRSYIRLFYLLNKISFSNDFHRTFANDFQNDTLDYFTVLKLGHEHESPIDSPFAKDIQSFYRNILTVAVSKFLNRNSPFLGTHQLLLSNYNDVLIVSDFKITPSWEEIKNNRSNTFTTFTCSFHLDKKDESISFVLNINVLELLVRLNKGYRPNKHDKNSVILLEDLVTKIKQRLILKKELTFINKDDVFEVEKDGNHFEVMHK
ncbi:DNA phosphorothioation-dependent restriction protein DptF [Enterobacter sp. HK-058-C-ECC]|uniref:DNA phosphorothioation-dependent restriction protein DptF n=1 Tax=Enterobacter sp. HK-058-C-ECC TaxID=3397227 RepID=UPI0039E0000E